MIQITEKYWLKADKNQFIIGPKVINKDGKEVVSGEWFPTDFAGVLNRFKHLEVADAINTGSWDAVADALRRVDAKIDDIQAKLFGW